MANKYFVAGVGRALLFKGENLFADCRTLADSSITVGVTAEDIRGGEGNVLYGQYYHDSTFSLKLTDIMFNVDFIAAQVGAEVELGGDVFEYSSVKCAANGSIVLPEEAVALTTGGDAFVWARPSDVQMDLKKYKLDADHKTAASADFVADTEYCIMYRKAVDGKKITVSSQFIPDTVHAVLTVALYSGDSCDVESATKAGEITIDIPRLQLTGAMDLSSATCFDI